ncbi:hypothetical protein G5714_016444 [Onychostoma macrolepis]|uniref:Uncharacterized protein n=1 Tax=Onychostoma macrolepis TaxID=369639 RepID=A0A7J6C936_9TELE|nr:hypothetical protein G5714_016444 [Onychostoma macrolepis]
MVIASTGNSLTLLTSDLGTVFTGPSTIYPATVTVQPTPPVTTVTYQQTPAVSVPPSVASPPDPATSGVSVLPQPRQTTRTLPYAPPMGKRL